MKMNSVALPACSIHHSEESLSDNGVPCCPRTPGALTVTDNSAIRPSPIGKHVNLFRRTGYACQSRSHFFGLDPEVLLKAGAAASLKNG